MKGTRHSGISFWLMLPVMLTFISGCGTTRETFDSKDLSYLYNPLKNSINPRYSVINQSDEKSVLSVKLMSNELFFSEANPRGVPMALMLVSVRLFNTTMGITLADTAYFDLEILKEPTREDYVYKIDLRVERGMDYVADVKVMDKIRQMMVQSFVPFDTRSEFNRYNFIIRGHAMKNEVSKPIVRKDQYFNVVYPRGSIDSLFVSVFQPYMEYPYPPSMVLPEKPGPTEPDTIIAMAWSDTLPLMLPNRGIYFCTTSRDSEEGFSIINFGQEYPAMTTPEVMIEPLAYLASPDELAAMKSGEKLKVALDEFWIKCGGNVEKARELIRIYYTRVVYANYYFTSYKEGWRSDRGMIYIVYGPPDKLYKTNNEETWGYRKPVVRSAWGSRYSVKEEYLFFTFKKRENRFSDNEYSLSRSETVVSYWDQAVLAWRRGIVFRLDNPADF